MKTRFIIVRHGESEANKNEICAGQWDIPLTEKGLKQAVAAREYLKNEKIDAFYSSTLQRARVTAETVAQEHGLPVTALDELMEMHRGIFERMPFTEIWEKYPKEAEILFYNEALFYIEGAETVDDAQNRVYEAFRKLGEKHRGQTVAVGFHGSVLRHFVAKVLKVEKADVEKCVPLSPNASITYVDYENGEFSLVKYGSDEHLRSIQ